VEKKMRGNQTGKPKKRPAAPRRGSAPDAGEQAAALELLVRGAGELGVDLDAGAQDAFRVYLEELQRWSARINLTALRTAGDIVRKHFLDSLAALPFLGEAASLADVGAGAGFPGLPLKLVRPGLKLTLVEARGKKAAFLEYLVGLLDLGDVEVAATHLTPALARAWGPRYAAVVSRGAFPLDRFLPLAAPLLLPNGRVLALKGPNLPRPELDAARRLAPALGLTPPVINTYRLPLSGEPRLAVTAIKGDAP
jgi:16S rRNA (guanine527-N7)-methyltransferase